MVLQDYKIDGEYITISKKELEIWKARCPTYVCLMARQLSPRITAAATVGMQSVINDILKMFETSEKWDFNMRSEFPADARDAADIEARINRKGIIMKTKFKKLHEGAVLPKKATEGSAAYDLSVPEDVIIKPGRQIIPLGFSMEMEKGCEALIDPRSGFSSKGMEGYLIVEMTVIGKLFEDCGTEKFVSMKPRSFDCDVIEGKIDSDYRDGVGVIVHNHGPEFLIKTGTRIAQMTFHKVETVEWEETDTLSETDRDGGFGSTGTK